MNKTTEISNLAKRMLGLPEVEITTGLSKPTIYRGIRAGTFPRPLKLSARRVGWDSTTIANWLDGLQTT